jgi:hypothetical protein
MKHSNQFFEQDMDDEEENERQRQFHHLAGRPRSAPDIHRHAVRVNRLSEIPAHKGTSDEEIATHFQTNILSRKHYNSTGKFFFFLQFLKSMRRCHPPFFMNE